MKKHYTRQPVQPYRQHKRAQNEAWTAVIIALLLISLMAIKFAVNSAFQHDLAQHNQELTR